MSPTVIQGNLIDKLLLIQLLRPHFPLESLGRYM